MQGITVLGMRKQLFMRQQGKAKYNDYQNRQRSIMEQRFMHVFCIELQFQLSNVPVPIGTIRLQQDRSTA